LALRTARATPGAVGAANLHCALGAQAGTAALLQIDAISSFDGGGWGWVGWLEDWVF
jgi:hypothetical protein